MSDPYSIYTGKRDPLATTEPATSQLGRDPDGQRATGTGEPVVYAGPQAQPYRPPGGPDAFDTLGQVVTDVVGEAGPIGAWAAPAVGGIVGGATRLAGQLVGGLGDLVGPGITAGVSPALGLYREVARRRIEGAGQPLVLGSSWHRPAGTLPADLQARLDAGERAATVADDLVARNAGYTADPYADYSEDDTT